MNGPSTRHRLMALSGAMLGLVGLGGTNIVLALYEGQHELQQVLHIVQAILVIVVLILLAMIAGIREDR